MLPAKNVLLENIKEWLGYADIQMTQRYAHMNVGSVKDEMAGNMNSII